MIATALQGLFSVVLAPVLVCCIQVLLNRIWWRKSAQFNAILSMTFAIVPYSAVECLVSEPFRHEVSGCLHALLIYCFSAYSYFHVFNMSETSRRIRLLSATARMKDVHVKELGSIYDDAQMIQVRLDRLIALGQLKKVGNRYYVKGKLFLWVGMLLHRMSIVLGCRWQAIDRNVS